MRSSLRVCAEDGRLRVSGEVDLATWDTFRAALDGAVDGAAGGAVVVDLGELSFLDAGGVSILLGAWRAARGRGGDLRVENATGTVAAVLRVLDLADVLYGRARE